MVDSTISASLFSGNNSTVTAYPITWPSIEPDHVHVYTIAAGTGTVTVVAGVATFSTAQTLVIGSRVRIGTTTYYIASRTSSTVYGFTTFPTISASAFWLTDAFTELAPAAFTYTLNGAGVLNSITTVAAVPTTSLVLVSRKTPVLQLVTLPTAGSLPAATLERMADRLTMQQQEAVTQASELSTSLPPGVFADAAARAAATPQYLGQPGIQLDTATLYYGSSLTAGGWTEIIFEPASSATAPTSPTDGDVYYDTTLGILRTRVGGLWVDSSPYGPFMLDTFWDANATALQLHHGEIGSWRLLAGVGGSNTASIASGTSGFSAAVGANAFIGVYGSSQVPATADYSVTGTLRYETNTGAFTAVGGRFDDVGFNGYLAGYASGSWYLYSVVAGTSTVIGQYAQSLVADVSHTIRLEMIGTSIKAYVDGVLRISATDANIAGPGRPALWFSGISTRTTGVPLDAVRADDGEIAPVLTNDFAIGYNGDSLSSDFYNLGARTEVQWLGRYLQTDKSWNFALNGKTVGTMNTENATTLAAIFPAMAPAKHKVSILQGGINDIINEGVSAATLITRITTWVALQKAAGQDPCVWTIPKATWFSGASETARTTVNTAITNGTVGATIVADTASDLRLQDITNQTYFWTDGVHLRPEGQRVVAEIIANAIKAYYGLNLEVRGTAASTSPTTGALRVAGGTGIAGTLNVGNHISVTGTVDTSKGMVEMRAPAGISDYTGITWKPQLASPDSASRAWQIGANFVVNGNLEIAQSTTAGGDPNVQLDAFWDSAGVFHQLFGAVITGNVAISGATIATPQALSGAGAVNITTGTTHFTSTGAAQALSLANGTSGQQKRIIHVVDGGSGVLTPTTKVGFTTITFTNAGESATLEYTAAGWAIVAIQGAVAA